MFGDRWQGWKCNQACRATLRTALPAALVSAVGSKLADSDAVQKTIKAIRELFERPVNFLRLGRFSKQLHGPRSPLRSIAGEAGDDLVDFFREYASRLREEAGRIARRFGLDQEAVERLQDRIDEYQRPLELTDPPPIYEP
jgi:plasmid stabilization system protein ParE